MTDLLFQIELVFFIFHHINSYLSKYETSLSRSIIPNSLEDYLLSLFNQLVSYVSENRNNFNQLTLAIQSNTLENRIIHGDPKISNILFDKETSG